MKNKRQEIEARLLDRTYEYQREIRDGYLGDNVSGDGAWPDYARLRRRGTAKASNGMAMVRKLSIQSRPLLPEPSLTYHTVINDVIVLSYSSFSQNRPSQHHSAQYPVFTSPYSLSSATPLPSFAITSAQHHSTQDHSSLPIVGLSSLWKVMGRPQVGRDSGKFLIGSVKSTCQSYPLASTASMICIPGNSSSQAHACLLLQLSCYLSSVVLYSLGCGASRDSSDILAWKHRCMGWATKAAGEKSADLLKGQEACSAAVLLHKGAAAADASRRDGTSPCRRHIQ